MYNEDQKLAFLTECVTNEGQRNIIEWAFESFSKYEEKFGKDLCAFDEQQLIESASEVFSARESGIRQRISAMKMYAKWCMLNGAEGACSGLLELDITKLGTDKLKRQTVANPAHLNRFLDCMFESPSEETADCIYRCYCWLAYSGMTEQQAVNVKDDDVDLIYRVVRIGEMEYPIYQESIDTFVKCINLTRFVYKNPMYPEKILFKKRYNGDLLLRGTSENVSPKTFRVELSRRQTYPNKRRGSLRDDEVSRLKLSYHRLQLSGLFYRTYEAERAGMPVDFVPAAEQFAEGKTYKLDRSNTSYHTLLLNLARSYYRDYTRWKDAYKI